MNERPPELRIGLIPRVVFWQDAFRAEYAAFLTNYRTVLVEEKSRTKIMPVPLMGVVIAATAHAEKDKKIVDYAFADPNALAALPGSLVWWHEHLRKVTVNADFSGVYLWFDREGAGALSMQKGYQLKLPEALVEQAKAEGRKKKELMKQYSTDAQLLLKRALPPRVVAASRWTV